MHERCNKKFAGEKISGSLKGGPSDPAFQVSKVFGTRLSHVHLYTSVHLAFCKVYTEFLNGFKT